MSSYNLAMYVVYIISVLLIVKAVRKAFFTQLVTFDDYLMRSKNFVIYFRNKTSAINILKKALASNRFTKDEENQLKIKIGMLYNSKKDYENAKKYFDEILEYVRKTKLPYDKELSAIVVAYYSSGDKDTARKVYHWLRAKEKYEPRFELFSYLDTYIFK